MAATTARTALSTPTKASPAPVTESPGSWQHPRLDEINRRREASTFTEKNIKQIVLNLGVLLGLFILHSFIGRALPAKRAAPQIWTYFNYTFYALSAPSCITIAQNLLPLVRAKDDLSDIPLTPGQRKLMGLPPSSAPPTPGSVYSTPPRYPRSPSASTSPARRRSFSGSFSGSPNLAGSTSSFGSSYGASTPTGMGSNVASPSNHLLQKAMLGARRSSINFASSIDSNSSMGASIFGAPDTPSPSPRGKRSTVELTSKWRYEKGMYEKVKGFRDSDFEPVFT